MRQQPLTPIVINFRQAVVDKDNNPIAPSVVHRMQITTPASALLGEEQTLKQVINYTIPGDGVVRLKLVPSGEFLPREPYKVEYFVGKSRLATSAQEWFVPYVPDSVTTVINHTGDERGDSLGVQDIFEVVSVSHVGEYVIEGNRLRWITHPPALYEPYTVVYQPGVTLRQLLVRDGRPLLRSTDAYFSLTQRGLWPHYGWPYHYYY